MGEATLNLATSGGDLSMPLIKIACPEKNSQQTTSDGTYLLERLTLLAASHILSSLLHLVLTAAHLFDAGEQGTCGLSALF